MSDREFGRLQAIDPATLWTRERPDFIAWLAETDTLEALGETIGLDMEMEAVDRVIGPLSADIVCRDTRDDGRVLIEAQLTATDNERLGRLISYAAGLEAGKVVWIATTFREEERAALDWLNRVSTARLSFYAVELRAFKLGGSPAAPQFHLISRPNDWSRRARSGVRAIETEEISEGRRLQQDYWSSLLDYLRQRGGPVHPSGKAVPRAWTGFRLGGHPGVRLSAVQQRKEKLIRAEITLAGEEAERNYAALAADRDIIESQIGYPLDWAPANERGVCRIGVDARAAALEDRADWVRQHQWLAERLEDLYRAFVHRVRALGDDDGDDEPLAAAVADETS